MADQPQPESQSLAVSMTREEINLSRFMRHRGGMSFAEIAKTDGVKVREVERSVKEVQAFRNFATIQEVDASQQEIIIALAEKEKRNLTKALDATQFIEKDGEIIEVPDWDVRMMAEDALNKKYAIARHKGGGVQVAVMNTNAVVPAAKPNDAPITATTSFEDVLRKIQDKRNRAALPESSAAEGKPLEGEIVEGG